MSFADALKFENYRHAAHACVWAPQEGSSSFGQLRAAVMVSSVMMLCLLSSVFAATVVSITSNILRYNIFLLLFVC